MMNPEDANEFQTDPIGALEVSARKKTCNRLVQSPQVGFYISASGSNNAFNYCQCESAESVTLPRRGSVVHALFKELLQYIDCQCSSTRYEHLKE